MSPANPIPPAIGRYPAYQALNYTYELKVSCFCADNRTVLITLHDGRVTRAVYAPSGQGHGPRAQERVPHSLRLTINRIIYRASKLKRSHVNIDWPAGQACPNFVSLDPNKRMADDEIGYTIANVIEIP